MSPPELQELDHAQAKRVLVDRADDRAGDHRHPGGNRTPELPPVRDTQPPARGADIDGGYREPRAAVLRGESRVREQGRPRLCRADRGQRQLHLGHRAGRRGPPPNFTITFTATGGQAGDGNLTLTSEGVKGPARASGNDESPAPPNHSAAPRSWKCSSPWSFSPSACSRWPGLQARLHVLQIESYQRAQALILLRDMASRSPTTATTAAELRHRGAARHGRVRCPTGHGHAAGGRRHRVVQRRSWAPAKRSAAAASARMVGGRGCVEDSAAATSTS